MTTAQLEKMMAKEAKDAEPKIEFDSMGSLKSSINIEGVNIKVDDSQAVQAQDDLQEE